TKGIGVHSGQDGAMVPGCRRGGDGTDADRLHDAVNSRVRGHADGGQPRNPRRRSMGLLTRSTESRNPGRFGDGNQWSQKSDAHGSSTRLANRRVSREELELDSKERMNVRVWLPASAGRSMPQTLPMVVGAPTPEQQQQSADDRENGQGLYGWRWAPDDIRGVGDQEKHCKAHEGPMADFVSRPGRVHVEPQSCRIHQELNGHRRSNRV